jgi:ureidoglycolate lyase
LTASPAPIFASDLTQEGFQPFGEVLAFDQGVARVVNDGYALRSDTPARLQASGGAPVLSVYRATPRMLPYDLTTMERHPFSTQAFIALTADRFLVVVAPADADGLPDLDAARAFVGSRGQGINYRLGVWHAPITALDQPGDFAMLMWERGTADDCTIHRSPTALRIDGSRVSTGFADAPRP